MYVLVWYKATEQVNGRKNWIKRQDYTRTKKRAKSQDPWLTNYWLQNMAEPTVRDPFSRNGRKFRRDFRIPFVTFEEIVLLMKATGEKEFNYAEKVVGGKPSIPLELKILCALRALASGLKFKDAADMSGFMPETAANKFFKEFNRLYKLYYSDTYINRLEGQELQNSMKQYSLLGLPGRVGSIATTFVPWDCCSANLTNLCNGDKGLQTSTTLQKCLSIEI